MGDFSVGLIILLFLILAAEFINGWTDAPNAIATVIATRVLSPVTAIIMAALFNLFGALSGTFVAETIGTEIVDASVIDMGTITSSMIATIIWGIVTARLGLPTSESHALVAGLGGAGIAKAGLSVLVWAGWKKVLIGLVLSTFFGFLGGLILMTCIYHIFKRCSPGKMRRSFHYLQMLSSAFMAFSHGSNDGQKFMGVFTLALIMGHQLTEFIIPKWVILLCGLVMAIGTLVGGWRILKTMGFRITDLQTPQGFCAETGAAATIQFASVLGIPLSTTHTINTAIMGVGATKRLSAVRWGVTSRIIMAWLLTFPACGLIGYGVARLGVFLTQFT
jgi:inorganic phosphate transporter, PiT family